MPKSRLKKIIEIILGVLYGLYLTFLLFIVYQLIRKLLGGSWGFEEIIIALLLANIGYSFVISSKLSKHLGMHEGYRQAVKNGKGKPQQK